MIRKTFLLSLLAVACPLMGLHAEDEYRWGSLPFGAGGFVTGIITSPQEQNLMYCRTDVGGAFRWVEETQSWRPITDWAGESECSYYGVESLAIDPNHTNVVYLYLGTSYWNSGLSGIFRSEDRGETFQRMANVTSQFPAHGNGYGRGSGEMLGVCPWDSDVLYCGSRTRGVWRSANQGRTWKRVGTSVFPNDQKACFVTFIEHNHSIIVGLQVKDAPNLFISRDEGETWTAIEGQTQQYMPNRCTVSQDSLLLVAYTDAMGPSGGNSAGALMKYDTYSGKWDDISPEHLSFGEISVSATDPKLMFATTYSLWRAVNWVSGKTQWGDQFFISRNGGRTWTNLMTSGKARFKEPLIEWAKDGTAQPHWCASAKIDPFNPQRVFIISGNGIFTCSNLFATLGNPTFSMAVTGLEMTVPTSLANVIGSPVVTTLGDVDGCTYYDIHQYTKKHTPAMGTTGYCCIAGLQPLTFVRLKSDKPQIYLTRDGAKSWKEVSGPSDVTDSNPYQYAALSANGGTLMVTPKDMNPYYTMDGGQTWTKLSGVGAGVSVHADFVEDNIFYIYYSGKLYTYRYNETTGRMTYSYKSITNVKNDRTMAVVPGHSGEIWLAAGSTGLYRVSNAHTTAPKTKRIALSYVTCVGVGKGRTEDAYPALYIWGKPKASDKTGIYRSDDEGTTWTRINDDLHQFGGPGNAQFVKGDMNVYGRVFMSTVGRGVIYGELVNGEDTPVRPVSLSDNSPKIDGLYDLQGRRITSDKQRPHCLYIKEGKKIVR
ncbi:MAG: hypothetical protein IJT48_05415 [Bacteroidaceae bacterium]|nr:hypothetical protein [Bacteroidaceae bacterium]